MSTPLAPFRVGLDLDGVLCDFSTRFLETLHDVSGGRLRRLMPADVRDLFTRYDWPVAAGFRQREIAVAWDRVAETPFWWSGVTPYFTSPADVLRIRGVLALPGFWCLTSRPQNAAGTVTGDSAAWLRGHYGVDDVRVLRTEHAESKGQMAAALALDLMIDDAPENLYAVKRWAPDCRVILVEQPWNAAGDHRTLLPTIPHTAEAIAAVVHESRRVR